MKKISLLIVFTGTFVFATAQGLKSPAEYLGYELGTQFSWHRDVVSYFKYVADRSESVTYKSYGKSYEGRELGVVFISSPENIQNLEQFRKENLMNIGLMEGEASGKQIPFIWLGYNVHGNEASGMEAALKTLYVLVTKSYEGSEEWLKKSVIVIDPCQNPDGRDRNTSRYTKTSSKNVNVNADDWSHHEMWPRSRSNHYLFDLNRDWVWQTQIETQQRIKLYNSYMPQVHADFHEMGFGALFYFAPGAKPLNEAITPWQLEFHGLVGTENAKSFNEQSRLYFTKEIFDLLYPGYGDSWPLFNGSIGLTYEQSRNVSSGINVKLDTKDTLTLKERIQGHFMASMATIKVSVVNQERLLSEFNTFFVSGQEKPQFEYKSIIIKGSNEKSALQGLLKILDGNQIRYSHVNPNGKKQKGFDYLNNAEGEFTLEKGDILVSAFQPQSHLIKVLFEPDVKLSDSLTFSYSAWALPYVFNVKAYAVKDKLSGNGENVVNTFKPNVLPETPVYAFLVNWHGFNEIRFMSELYKHDLNIRYSLKNFILEGKAYNRGTLIIAKGDNSHIAAKFDEIVVDAANKCGISLVHASSGLSDKGPDLGSALNTVLNKKPKVALIGGKGINSSKFGQLWYFFDNEIEYPVSILGTDYLTSVDLSKYDVVLLPSGAYTDFKQKILNYVKGGGQLVAFEKAIVMFAADTTTNIHKSMKLRKKEVAAVKVKVTSSDTTHLRKFEDRLREKLSATSAGGIYRVILDDSHPYSFGLGKAWFILKGSSNYAFLSSGTNVGYILESDPVSGFAGSKFRKEVKNTMVISSEKIGKGEVIYISDDPYNIAFWKSGRILLGNIIFR